MSGKKGRSGRKPNESGTVMRAVALYIPMTELDISHPNSGSGKAKYKWFPEDWFRQFKRINGNKWQERVRTMITAWTKNYELYQMWDCECSGREKKWHFKHEGICPRCDKMPLDIERFKTVAEVNKNVHKPLDSTPLKLCTTCKKPLSSKPSKFGMLWFCESCPGRHP